MASVLAFSVMMLLLLLLLLLLSTLSAHGRLDSASFNSHAAESAWGIVRSGAENYDAAIRPRVARRRISDVNFKTDCDGNGRSVHSAASYDDDEASICRRTRPDQTRQAQHRRSYATVGLPSGRRSERESRRGEARRVMVGHRMCRNGRIFWRTSQSVSQ